MGNGNARNQRIDTVKFLLILAIYIFHNENAAGGLYPFLSVFPVASFFVISGFWALRKLDQSVWDFTRDAFRKYLFGWLIWVFVYTAFYCVNGGYGIRATVELFFRYFLAVRGTGIWGMWFTPAFFAVTLCYLLLGKITLKITGEKRETIAAINCGISFLIYFCFQFFVKGEGWVFSLNHVPQYLFYYSFGTMLIESIPEMRGWVLQSSRRKTVGSCAVFLICAAYLTLYYFKKEQFIWGFFNGAERRLLFFLPEFVLVTSALIVTDCFADLVASDVTETLGKESLGLCYCEALAKKGTIMLGSLFGFQISVSTPVQAVFFSCIAIAAGHWILLPIINRIQKKW